MHRNTSVNLSITVTDDGTTVAVLWLKRADERVQYEALMPPFEGPREALRAGYVCARCWIAGAGPDEIAREWIVQTESPI